MPVASGPLRRPAPAAWTGAAGRCPLASDPCVRRHPPKARAGRESGTSSSSPSPGQAATARLWTKPQVSGSVDHSRCLDRSPSAHTGPQLRRTSSAPPTVGRLATRTLDRARSPLTNRWRGPSREPLPSRCLSGVDALRPCAVLEAVPARRVVVWRARPVRGNAYGGSIRNSAPRSTSWLQGRSCTSSRLWLTRP